MAYRPSRLMPRFAAITPKLLPNADMAMIESVMPATCNGSVPQNNSEEYWLSIGDMANGRNVPLSAKIQ